MAHNTTWEESGIYWQFFGYVSAQEVEEANNEMYGDLRFDDIKYFIWDMSNATGWGMTESDAAYSAATDKGASRTTKKVKGALISNDEKVRAIMNIYIEVSSKIENPWELRIFNKLEDAREWVSP